MSNTRIALNEFFQLHHNLPANELILDVRGADEFAAGHIPKAVNIPCDQIAGRVDELKDYSKIYIHCKRGGRAQTAYECLEKLGLNNLVCISDAGMDAWIESGYPVKSY